MFDRRTFLGGAGGAVALLAAPHIAVAQAATDRRFVFIIQRGAADGLGTLAPTGDPAFAGLRGAFAEDFAGGARLGDFHPASEPGRDGAALRGARGAVRPRRRLALSRPLAFRRPERARDRRQRRLCAARRLDEPAARPAAAQTTRGRSRSRRRCRWCCAAAARSPPTRPRRCPARRTICSPGSAASTRRMPSSTPPGTQAMQTRAMAGDLTGERRPERRRHRRARRAAAGRRRRRADRGDRDRRLGHPRQPARPPRLPAARPRRLIGALKTGLGADWANTLVLVATEFGRTAAPNGTGGTDHGTASMAMLLGGAVAGGRVVADWPGLGQPALYEGRDLKPTTDLDTLIASAVCAALPARSWRATGRTLFPNIGNARPLEGLIRA